MTCISPIPEYGSQGKTNTVVDSDPAPVAPLPIRQVTRLIAEMQTSIVRDGIRLCGGSLDRFIIFTLVVRQSALWAISGDGEDSEPPRPISTYSLAQSLGRAFETVRRHVNFMIANGLCERTPQGIIARAEGMLQPEAANMLALVHDCFVRFVDDLAALDFPLPSRRHGVAYDPPVAIRAAADMLLAVIDTNTVVHPEWLNLTLFSTILCANARPITRDPELARAFADGTRPIPTTLRDPIRPTTVARVLGLSRATTQRHIEHLVAKGMLERVGGGVAVSNAWMVDPTSVAVSTATYHNIRRILSRVASAGFPFDDPASAYLGERPPAVRFD